MSFNMALFLGLLSTACLVFVVGYVCDYMDTDDEWRAICAGRQVQAGDDWVTILTREATRLWEQTAQEVQGRLRREEER
jgi:hypothetical protein